MNRILVALLAAGLCLCLNNPSAAADEQPAIKVGALFSVTGPSSFLGGPEARISKMLVDDINAKGGVAGRKIELLIKDTMGDPEKAISFAKQLIEEEKVFAIIGPSTSGESLKIKKLCQDNKTILLSCAAAESIVEPLLPYVFKTPQKDSYAAQSIYQRMKEMGLTKVGIVSDNTGFGAGGKSQLEKYAPEYGITIVGNEVYDKGETDLTAVATKIKSSGAQAVVNWSVVPAQSIVMKNFRQVGFTGTLFQSHGFGNIKYVKAAGAAAEGVLFPCGRLLVAEELPDDHPQKALLVKCKKDYEDRFKEDVSTFGGHAYDAIVLLVEAIKKSGPDMEKARRALENLKGVPGTAGIFNMSPQDHNGLTINSFEMLTVKDGKFAISKP